jgi:hypothetical protein
MAVPNHRRLRRFVVCWPVGRFGLSWRCRRSRLGAGLSAGGMVAWASHNRFLRRDCRRSRRGLCGERHARQEHTCRKQSRSGQSHCGQAARSRTKPAARE